MNEVTGGVPQGTAAQDPVERWRNMQVREIMTSPLGARCHHGI